MKRELWYSIVIRDRDGKVLHRERHRSKSFVRQWNDTVYMHASQHYEYNIKSADGTSPVTIAGTDSFNMTAPAGNAAYGIVIGTGDTLVAVSDYCLAAIIANGGGAGQMNYQACSIALSVVSAPNCGFIVSRSIVNNSGGLITVKESGIYFRLWSAPQKYYCGLRDVFGTPQDVPNGGSISINYTLRVTV